MKFNPRPAARRLSKTPRSNSKQVLKLIRPRAGLVLIAFFASIIGYSFRGRSPGLAISLSAIPGFALLFCALRWRSLWFLLGSVCALTTAVTEYLYSNFVVQIISNDFANACPVLIFLFMTVVDLGTVESARVQAFYLTVFQSLITVLGIVFTFGVFLLQTQNFPHAQFRRDALIGFSCLYSLVIMLTLLGIILPTRDINFSHQYLDARQPDRSNWLNVAVFFATYCLTAASAAYLVFVFLIFLK